MRRALALIFLLAPFVVRGQDVGKASHIRTGASLPPLCQPTTGDTFFLTSGQVGIWDCTATNTWTFIGGGPGTGTVVSVAQTVPPELTIAGSPITTSGTLAIGKATETQDTVWAGSCGGGTAQPAFRALCAADLPGGIGTVSSIAATAPIVVSPNPITTTGTVSCPTCVTTATSPVKRIILPFGLCANGTPSSAWDLPTTNAAVAGCKTGGTNGTVQGTLLFADGQLAYYTGVIPSDWVSWGVSRLTFTTADTTNGHTVIFNALLACEAPNAGNTDDPAYGAANAFGTVTIGGGAIANASYQTSTGALTGGGCAAGSVFHIQLKRVTDSDTDTAVTASGWLEVLYNGGFN